MTTGRRATSMDVADVAGVSQPTVSRALRGEGSVSAETRDRILAAARELNYVPDERAARLRSRSTGVVALVILGLPGQERAAINPFYFELLGAVGSAAAKRGYDLLVSFQDHPDTLRADFEQARKADGLIVLGSSRNAAGWRFFAKAMERGDRIVCWGAPDDAVPVVRCGNRAGAILAVRHLLDQGRRRIAFVGPGWRGHRAFRERRNGYRAALMAAGETSLEARGIEEMDRREQGRAMTEALLLGGAGCDAVFAASDLLALGAIDALDRAGVRVPEEVAVVGFDGIPAAAHARPALTTIEQDTDAAGKLLVDALLAQVEGRGRPRPGVPCRLVVRGSSDPLCLGTQEHARTASPWSGRVAVAA